MQTQDGVLDTTQADAKRASRVAGGMFSGIGETTVLAVCALVGCGVLIALGTALSMCWAVHPLLTPVAAVPLLWLIFWVLGKLFWSDHNS